MLGFATQVKKMSNRFNLATSFNQPLDGWNMKKEMDLSGMFMDASSFNQPLQNWRVEKVRDIGAMFDGAYPTPR